MTLNITLLVQIVHFLIAYWFLRRWLFVPLFAHILEQERQHEAHEAELATQQERVRAAQHEQTAELQACSRYFSSNKPNVEEQPPPVEHVSEVIVHELTPAEQKQLQHDVTAVLMKKAQQ